MGPYLTLWNSNAFQRHHMVGKPRDLLYRS